LVADRERPIRAKRRHSVTDSFDHIGAGQERRRDVDARPRGLGVVGKLELRVLIGPRRMASMLLAVRLFSSANADLCYEYLLSHRHVFPFASILARII
jgi:hypothetical protein